MDHETLKISASPLASLQVLKCGNCRHIFAGLSICCSLWLECSFHIVVSPSYFFQICTQMSHPQTLISWTQSSHYLCSVGLCLHVICHLTGDMEVFRSVSAYPPRTQALEWQKCSWLSLLKPQHPEQDTHLMVGPYLIFIKWVTVKMLYKNVWNITEKYLEGSCHKCYTSNEGY